MLTSFAARERVLRLRRFAAHQNQRIEFAIGKRRRERAKKRRNLAIAGVVGGGLGVAGLATLASRGKRGGGSSISSPALSSVAPRNVTAQSSVSSVRSATPSPPSSSASRQSDTVALNPATKSARKKQINSQIVADRKAAYLGGKTVADIKRRKKQYRNTQRVLTRRRDLGRTGYELRDLQAKRQNLKRAIVNKDYGSRKELRQLGRDYAKTSQRITGAKREVDKIQNPDLYRRLDALNSYLITSGMSRKR